MAGDTFRRYRQGEPFVPRATTLNAWTDAAEAFQRSGKAGAGDPRRIISNPCEVLIRNDSGEDREQFEVLGISGSVFSPADAEQQYRNQIVLTGGLATSVNLYVGKWVVCQEPIRDGEIGRAVIDGLTVAKVYPGRIMGYDDYRWCDLHAADSILFGRPLGYARILHWLEADEVDDADAVRLAVIQLNAPRRALVCKRVDGSSGTGSMTVAIRDETTNTYPTGGPRVIVYSRFFSVADGAECYCDLTAGENTVTMEVVGGF